MTAIEIVCVLAGLLFGWASALLGLLLVTNPSPRFYFSKAAAMMAHRGQPEAEAHDEAARVIRSVYLASVSRRA